MNRTDHSEQLHAALIACEKAIGACDYSEADRHLHEAKNLGASADVVARHTEAIRKARSWQSTRNRRGVLGGFALALLGYLILSGRQPAGWGEVNWAALALLFVPALAGIVTGRLQAPGRTRRQAFFAGSKAAGWAMFFYSAVTLIVLANRVQAPDAAGEFLAGTLTVVAATAIAAAAAGLANLLVTRATAGRDTHEPASR